MLKKILFLLLVGTFCLLFSVTDSFAGTIEPDNPCPHKQGDECITGYSCRQDPNQNPGNFICLPRVESNIFCERTDPDPCIAGYSCSDNPAGIDQRICLPDSPPAAAPPPAGPGAAPAKNSIQDIFGQIKPPGILGNLVANSKTSGAGVISQFLSNLILLIYSIAGIVLVFMIIWGAFEWLTSGGDKEKIEGARKRIISAIVGIILFAVAFAIIRIFGRFTGFTFFM